ncbi:MAG: peroxiredoxin family protein [Prevotella sp.]|jgi:peroxiredoxin
MNTTKMKRYNILKALTLAIALFTSNVSMGQQTEQDPDKLYATELIKIGETAPEIEALQPNGKSFKLSTLRGHYVVIDFWASWCPDCRKDIPNVLKMYKEFHPKGVEFVGVSFDDKAESWKNAIAKYNLEYTHVSELTKMRESAIAKAYGIKWIPSMYIIDPEGKVVLSTVVSDKVEKRLNELASSNSFFKSNK